MKKIIVTGGSGFIGSNIVDELINMGHNVIVIDNESAECHENFYYNNLLILFFFQKCHSQISEIRQKN